MLWLAAALLSGCGGGNSSVTTVTGGGVSGAANGPVVVATEPSGGNTTEVIVDSGPASGFSLGVTNVPYVTVTVCSPGSTSRCAVIDHVFLDTGSVGFRVLKSTVASLALPTVAVAADPGRSTAAGAAFECYPFVIGAVWGPMATADLRVADELASNLPIQVIDDDATPSAPVPDNCRVAANGGLLNSVGTLQAKGVLGVGMIRYDCGLRCQTGNYAGGYVMYYSCRPDGSNCSAAAVPAVQQVQNPVTYFAVDNNGTLVVMPQLPQAGASVAKGRLAFGIGTRGNNQIQSSSRVLRVDANPNSDTYLYLTTATGGNRYPNSYIDSGSNGLFFDDSTLAGHCNGANGPGSSWFCPPALQQRSAVLTDAGGVQAGVDFTVASAEVLFNTTNSAFSNLAGGVGANGAGVFVWGMPFFYGRTVYTSIWGQALSPDGPWFAF